MNRRDAVTCYVLMLVTLVGAWVSRAAESYKGNWTVSRSSEAGKVEFTLIQRHDGHNSTHSSDWPLSALQGLDLSKAGKQEVHFTISRDAGRFDCEGYVDNGEGAGLFHFFPDQAYAREMSALGFGGIDEDKQYSMAVMDVSITFAKQTAGPKLLDAAPEPWVV